MSRRPQTLLDLGDTAQGQVLDADLWHREQLCRVAEPVRAARGEVRAVFVHFPHVVAIVTPAGEALTIRAMR